MNKCINETTGIEYNFMINNCEVDKNNIYNFIKSVLNSPIKIIDDKIYYTQYNYDHIINKNDILLSQISDKTMIYIVNVDVFKNDFRITK